MKRILRTGPDKDPVNYFIINPESVPEASRPLGVDRTIN